MVRFTKARRELLAERFGELANFAVAGLVFGQAVGQEAYSTRVAIAGMAVWMLLLGFALVLKGGRQ